MSELTEEQLAHLSKNDRILVLTPPDKTSGGKRKRRKKLLEKIFSEEPPKSGKDDHGLCGLMPSQDQDALREKAHQCHQILQKDHNELLYIATPSRKLYILSIDIAKKNEDTIRWLIEKYPKIRTADKREEVFERTIRKLEMTRETKDPQDPGNEEEQQQAPKGVSPACSRERGKQIDSEEIPWYGDLFEQEEFNTLDSSLPYLALDDQAVEGQGIAGSSGRERAPSPPPALSSTTGNPDSNAVTRPPKRISLQTLNFDESEWNSDSNLRTSYRRSFKLRDGEGKVLSPLQTYLFSVNAARLSPARRQHKNALIDMFRIWRRTGDRPKMVSCSTTMTLRVLRRF